MINKWKHAVQSYSSSDRQRYCCKLSHRNWSTFLVGELEQQNFRPCCSQIHILNIQQNWLISEVNHQNLFDWCLLIRNFLVLQSCSFHSTAVPSNLSISPQTNQMWLFSTWPVSHFCWFGTWILHWTQWWLCCWFVIHPCSWCSAGMLSLLPCGT